MTKILYCYITVGGTMPFLTMVNTSKFTSDETQENIHVSFTKLSHTIQNNIQKLESNLLKPYLI